MIEKNSKKVATDRSKKRKIFASVLFLSVSIGVIIFFTCKLVLATETPSDKLAILSIVVSIISISLSMAIALYPGKQVHKFVVQAKILEQTENSISFELEADTVDIAEKSTSSGVSAKDKN